MSQNKNELQNFKICNVNIDVCLYELPNTYNFSCGYKFVTIEGDLEENGINFCPSCGGKIIIKNINKDKL